MSTNRNLLEILNTINNTTAIQGGSISIGNRSIVIGNGGNVTIRNVGGGRSTSISNSILIGDKEIQINGHTYALNDPTAPARLPEEHRELFWSMCAAEAKDSELYRNHVNKKFKEANINLENVNNPELKSLIANNANDVIKLVECFRKLNYSPAFNVLINIEPNYLKLMISKAYNTSEFLSKLYEVGYKDPLALILSSNLERLTYLVDKRYEAIEIIKKLAEIRYQNPLQKLLSIDQNKLIHLFEHRYEFGEFLKAFYNHDCSDPLSKLLNIDSNKLNQLFNHRYESIELLKCFTRVRYANPVQTLLDLDTTIFLLFCGHRYDAIEIMNALSSSGIQDPINYLARLGTNGMITVFGNRYDYVKKIEQGVNIAREFQIVNLQPVSNINNANNNFIS